MASNIIAVCDYLVDVVEAAWTGITADDSVERVYVAPIKLHEQAGRHVFIYPLSYSNQPATRGHDEWSYQIGVIVIEGYEQPGEPTKAWMDDRVDFVQDKVFDPLDFSRSPAAVSGGLRMLTTEATCDVYNIDQMIQEKQFRSELRFTFTEIRGA